MCAKILVVDDDQAIRRIVQEALEISGMVVQTSADGAQALRAVERASPDLVILDLEMPAMDGFAFAHALQARGRAVPIVVMSASSRAPSAAKRIGAAALLRKPFAIAELLDTVERALRPRPTMFYAA